MKNKYSKLLELLGIDINQYLPTASGAIESTIKSYKYTFHLLFKYLYSERGLQVDAVRFEDLDSCTTEFINWLETEHHYSASMKNQRLSVLFIL